MKQAIGFVGGGRMAEALIRGIVGAGLQAAEKIHVAEPQSERRRFLREEHGVQAAGDAARLAAECPVIVLAVKPQVMDVVLAELRPLVNSGHLLISIAAGVTLDRLSQGLAGSGCRLIRVMPNTPALVGEGAAAISPGPGCGDEDLAAARRIFEAVGAAIVVDERYMDAVTGLSGSGPAYVFAFVEAMIDAGVKVGLARPEAETLVLQTVLGSVKLAMATGEHPAQLRAMVTSPGGTTIAGLHEMARAGFAGIVMDAVEAAARRSAELGR